MKIGLKFNVKSYLKFSSKKVGWAKGRWGGGDDPTEKDGSSRILEGRSGAGDVLDTLQSDCVEFRALFAKIFADFVRLSSNFNHFT